MNEMVRSYEYNKHVIDSFKEASEQVVSFKAAKCEKGN